MTDRYLNSVGLYINKSDKPIAMHQMAIYNYTDLHNMAYKALSF